MNMIDHRDAREAGERGEETGRDGVIADEVKPLSAVMNVAAGDSVKRAIERVAEGLEIFPAGRGRAYLTAPHFSHEQRPPQTIPL